MKSPLLIRITFIFLLLAWIISHIPFLSADADLITSTNSRSAWTDEGLFTMQIRNFIDHGRFEILDSDTFLKTPLFEILMYAPFKLFETEMETGRISILFFLALALILFSLFKEFRSAALFLIPTTLMLFMVHQYSHIGIAEMMVVSVIFVAGMVFTHYISTGKKKYSAYTFILLLAAVLLKIQFVYILAIPALCILFENIADRKRIGNKPFLVSFITAFVIIIFLFLAWYLPLRNEFSAIAKAQSGSFYIDRNFFHFLKENLSDHFINRNFIFFTFCYSLAVITAFLLIFRKKVNGQMRSMMIFSLGWTLVELHKLPMEFLPSRYMVSMYFSMGLLISLVSAHIMATEKKIFKTAVMGFTAILFLLNSWDYYHLYNRRTFAITELNNYFASYDLKDKTMLGMWANSLNWGSKSLTFPVWKSFKPGENFIQEFDPAVVVSEYNEEDSENYYSSQGIDLAAISDSVRQVKIAYWKVNIYWISPKKIKRI